MPANSYVLAANRQQLADAGVLGFALNVHLLGLGIGHLVAFVVEADERVGELLGVVAVAVLLSDDVCFHDARAFEGAAIDANRLRVPLLGECGFDVAVGQDKIKRAAALEVLLQRVIVVTDVEGIRLSVA